MRKWEDIVKDKMEEADGTLPESVFAEFRARREAAADAPIQKRFPLVWALAPAVAAVLAAVLLLHKPAVPEGDIQLIQQPSAPIVEVTDSTTVSEPEQPTPLVAQVATPKPAQPQPVTQPQSFTEPQPVAQSQEEAAVETVEPAVDGTRVNLEEEKQTSPFIPEKTQIKPVKMKVGLAAGAVAGGGLLAAAIIPESSSTIGGNIASIGGTHQSQDVAAKDILIGNPVHYFPLRLGLSARIPVADRLYASTGIRYTLYQSTFNYSLSGEKRQQVHYLGIPLRMDWVFASNRWLDVYVGGGLEGDLCVGATFAGEKISKDAFSLSVQGVGGIQFNVTRQLGFYVEPELSWRVPMGHNDLVTYRSTHPLMFTVAAGARFTFGK